MPIQIENVQPRQYLELFRGRQDRVMVYAQGKEITVQVKRGDFELSNRVDGHLKGQARLGFYNMQEDFSVSWFVVVFEQGGKSQDTVKDSLLLVKELRKLGFNGVRREITMREGDNFHVWVFLDPPVKAKKVRYFLFNLLEKLGLPKDLPIIPSKDELEPGGFGQAVWLPYFNGVDKWLDEKGNPYMCNGLKQDRTVFIDDQGKVIERLFLNVPKHNEQEIDQSIKLLGNQLKSKYLPQVGLVIEPDSVKKLLQECIAYKTIVTEIDTKGFTSDLNLTLLAILLKNLGQEKLLNDYIKKIVDFDQNKFDGMIAKYSGPMFPTCLTLKQVGLCPPEHISFGKYKPLVEKFGQWKEDAKAEATLEPTPAMYLFEAVAEQKDLSQMGEEDEEEAPPPAVKVDVFQEKEEIEVFEVNLDKKIKAFAKTPAPFSGLNTGFDALNSIIDGLAPGDLILLCGKPSSGKTTFTKQMFDQVIDKEKVKGVFISYINSKEELRRKSIARLAGISYKKIRTGDMNPDEIAKVKKVLKYLKDSMGEFMYTAVVNSRANIVGVEQAIKQTEAVFCIVDHIQAIALPNRLSGLIPDQRYDYILTQLKQTARDRNVPIVAISGGPVTPGMEHAADVIMVLNPQVNPKLSASDNQPYINLLNIEKNRKGISKVTLQYTFFPPRMYFYGEKIIEYRPV